MYILEYLLYNAINYFKAGTMDDQILLYKAKLYPPYADLIVRGEDPYTAAALVGVDSDFIDCFVAETRASPLFRKVLERAYEAVDVCTLWNEKRHIVALVRMAQSAGKGSDRIAALDRLADLFDVKVNGRGQTKQDVRELFRQALGNATQ